MSERDITLLQYLNPSPPQGGLKLLTLRRYDRRRAFLNPSPPQGGLKHFYEVYDNVCIVRLKPVSAVRWIETRFRCRDVALQRLLSVCKDVAMQRLYVSPKGGLNAKALMQSCMRAFAFEILRGAFF